MITAVSLDPHLLWRLFLALGIGLLIGLERGWQARAEADGNRIAGWRSFGILGLLGGLGALLARAGFAAAQPVLLASIALFFAIAYWHDIATDKHWSITTALTALATFCLGGLSMGPYALHGAAAAVILTILLAARETMHGALRRLTPDDLHATLRFLLIAAVILPWLPDQPMGPFGLLNPFRLWLMLVLISGLSFAGYWATRIFGGQRGLFLTAAAGGLVSSTATTFSLARLASVQKERTGEIAAAILISCAIMPVRVTVLLVATNAALAGLLLPPLAAGAAVLAAAAFLLMRRSGTAGQAPIATANPLQLGTAALATIGLAAFLILIELANQHFGSRGVLLLSFFSGLADVDAMTLSNAALAKASLQSSLAAQAILVGTGANALFKSALAMIIAPRAVGLPVFLAHLLAMLAAAAFFLLV